MNGSLRPINPLLRYPGLKIFSSRNAALFLNPSDQPAQALRLLGEGEVDVWSITHMLGYGTTGDAARRIVAVDLDRHPVLEKQQRAWWQHRQRVNAIEQQIAADPFRFDFGDIQPTGDGSQFIDRQDRQLSFIAHFCPARIPRLSRPGLARVASVNITWNAFESQRQLIDGAGHKVSTIRLEQTGDRPSDFLRRLNIRRVILLPERIHHRLTPAVVF